MKKQLIKTFCISFISLMIISLLMYIYGKFTFVSNDCFYQYISFFEIFYQKIINGENLLLTNTIGLNTDFYSIFCYYLSSPLNFIIFIFPHKYLIETVSFLIILKLSLCSVTFTYFLIKKYGENNNAYIFSLIWIFCGYFAGYCWNIMWLDAIILFPILIIEMENLIYKKEFLKYSLILGISIICNYFMSYIICIFLLLNFFTMKFDNIKDFIFKGLRFVSFSILSVGISGIVIIPTFFTLKTTSINSENIPLTLNISLEMFKNFKNLFIGQIPFAITYNPYHINLQISLIIILLFFIYLFNNKILILNKLKNITLLIFLFISTSNDFLNFLWHGFHNQTSIPNRFSFLINFILIYCAYETFLLIKEIKNKEKIIATIFYILFLIVILFNNKDLLINFILTILISLIYFLFLIKNKLPKILITIEIIVCFIFGSLFASTDTLKTLENKSNIFNEINSKYNLDKNRCKYEEILLNENNKPVQLKAKLYQNIIDKNYKEILKYKTAFINSLKTYKNEPIITDSAYYQLNTPSIFSTFLHEGYSTLLNTLGNMGSINLVMYSKDNIATDMLLGIKYALIPKNYTQNPKSDTTYSYIETIGNINIYKNNYSLSKGFLIDKNIKSISEIKKENQFENINKLYSIISGNSLFQEETFEIKTTKQCQLANHRNKNPNENQLIAMQENAKLIFEYTAKENRNDYFFIHCADLKCIKIFINDILQTERSTAINMINLGNIEKNDIIRIELLFYETSQTIFNAYLYSLNKDNLNYIYNKLQENQLNLIKDKENYIEGYIQKKEGKNLLLTIPYSPYWKLYINNELTEIETFANAFMYIPLQNGNNHIILKYNNYHITIGIIISLISLSILLIMYKKINTKNT